MGPVNLILIGPPGSGKGTQASRICERYSVPLIATGDILRTAVKAGTPLGFQVQSILSSGGLVGDAMMVDLVRERLAGPDTADGFVLDGFPRTLGQAEALETLIAGRSVRVILLDVPESELERRLTAPTCMARLKGRCSTASSLPISAFNASARRSSSRPTPPTRCPASAATAEGVVRLGGREEVRTETHRLAPPATRSLYTHRIPHTHRPVQQERDRRGVDVLDDVDQKAAVAGDVVVMPSRCSVARAWPPPS